MMADDGPRFSELEDDEREQAFAYVRARWAQYSSATRDSRRDAATFIATINAGGAAAVLAFAGAIFQKDLARAVPLGVALLFFVAGVICTASAHVIENGRINGLFATWRGGVDELYEDKVSFGKLRLDDVRRAGEYESVAVYLLRGALVFFVIGAGLGVCLFFAGA